MPGRRLSTEEKAARAALRLANSRWFISFSLKGSYGKYGAKNRWGETCYVHGAWPLLFKSPQEAWDYAASHNAFKNSQETSARGRIVSYSLTRIKLNKDGP